jgi:3-hydroxyisobutyrate dehydrogenase-like beta-hydroxyacid dehydrogenase
VTATVGVVGLGGMGSILAQRLIDGGHRVLVTNRTPSRAEALIQNGAHWADTPAQLAADSDVVLSMVANDEALGAVALGVEGVLAGAHDGLVFADLSTVSLEASAAVAVAAVEAGVEYLRAPVTGSTALARDGQLRVMCSGSRAAKQACAAPFATFSVRVFDMGSADEARVMKLAINSLLATSMAGMSEALVFGAKAGLDWQAMLDVFSDSAVASPLVKYKSATLSDRNFDPAFTTSLLAKDVQLMVAAARQHGAVTPLSASAEQLLLATAGLGWGDADFSAITLLYERLAGIPDDTRSKGSEK